MQSPGPARVARAFGLSQGDVGVAAAAAAAARRASSLEDTPGPGIAVGARVRVSRKHDGTIRFVGQTQFSTGIWVGVELDSPDGKNDGSVQGERYFTCAPQMGLFTRASTLELLTVPESSASDQDSIIDSPRRMSEDDRGDMFEVVGTCAQEVEKLTAVVGRLDAALEQTLDREASANAGAAVAGAAREARCEEWLGGASDQLAGRLEEKLRQSLEEQLRAVTAGPLEELLWLAQELQKDYAEQEALEDVVDANKLRVQKLLAGAMDDGSLSEALVETAKDR